VSTTGSGRLRFTRSSFSIQPGSISSTWRYRNTNAFSACDCVLADTRRAAAR
jgi:hypothetical protein